MAKFRLNTKCEPATADNARKSPGWSKLYGSRVCVVTFGLQSEMSDPQHIAYQLANIAIRAAKVDVTGRLLSEVDCYDSTDPDDISRAVMITEQAFDLCHQADKIARQMMNSHTHEAAIAELKRRRPGYTDKTYTQAILEAFAHASR